MKKIKILICVLLISFISWRIVNKCLERRRERNIAHLDHVLMNRFFECFAENPQKNFYDLYLEERFLPYAFISTIRTFNDRKTAGLRERFISKSHSENRKMTLEEFNMLCDYEVFFDRDGVIYILDKFTKKFVTSKPDIRDEAIKKIDYE